jgi:hypothetical protein
MKGYMLLLLLLVEAVIVVVLFLPLLLLPPRPTLHTSMSRRMIVASMRYWKVKSSSICP